MSNPFDQFDTPPRRDGRTLRYDAPELDAYADEVTARYGLPPGLIRALKNAGERSNSWQVSPAGARGVMQFMPQNLRQYGVVDPTDPYEMIDAAGRYLRDTSRQYGGDVRAMIADYNGGPRQARRVQAGLRPAASETAAYLNRVETYLGLNGGSGGGGGSGSFAGNPFDQFDAEPSANPFDQFDPSPQPDFANVQSGVATTETPNFGNVRSGVQTTEVPSIASIAAPPPTGEYRPGTLLGRSFNSLFGAVAPDSLIRAIDNYEGFDPTTPTGIAQAPASEAGDLTDMGLRSILRVPQLAGQLVDLIPNAGDATIRALGGDPDRSVALALLRQGLGGVSDAAQEPVRLADAAGVGRPSVTAEQTLDALDPRTDAGILDRLQTVGTFIPETLVGSGGDMAAAVAAPYAYLGARTNEIAETRAANDQREDVSLADLAVAAPAAGVETFLERLTTGRLLPGGAVYAPGGGSVAGRIARETALQGGSGGIEELVPYLAETVGTERGATGREALATLVAGVLSEGALGAGAQGGAEVAQALQRPTPSAVAAEVPVSPRQDAAPAVPPPIQAQPEAPAVRDQQAPGPESRTEPSVSGDVLSKPLNLQAATRAIDNRLAALDEAAAGQIDEAEVSALNAERQELDDLVREQDRARREGIIQPLEARLTPEERATADARRQEIAATLERHRAARTAADQAQRLRGRLESADTDAALYEVAREIDPTLGTPQAESFRASAVKENSAPQSVASPPAARATPSVPVQAPSGPIETNAGTTPNVGNVADRSAQSEPIVGQRPRSEQPSAPPAAAPETGIPVSPRAESQREPAAEPMPQGQTGVRNAVTDAERIAEGRDPIIREARKANRETVDEAVRALRETPTLGRETANRLASGGPVELKDEAVLLVHKVDLRKRRDTAAERAQSPDLSEEARATARREYDDLVQQIDEVDQAAVRVGTESGRLLQLRRRMIAEDYSLPALERKLRMVVNRDLKPGERAELKEMADKVADLQRKLDAAESKQASAQVAEMLARLMKSSPGRGATLEQRRAAAAESRAALSAMASARGEQRSITPAAGKPGQARDALVDRLGRGVVRQLERDGVLKFEGPAGGSWDGATIRIGDVNPENALGVLLHEASHARLAEVMGADGYDRALRDLDALEESGDATAVRAARRAARSGETGARLDDERLAYMVEEAAKANRTTGGVSAKARELVRRVLSAFRQWAATSPVYRALERLGLPRPTLQPDDFVAFARASLRRLMDDAATPEARRLRGKIGALETELRTDRLTGMRNRRAFDEDESLGWPTVAAIDMDGLGKLNEAVGHEPANKVLQALADTFMAAETDGIRVYRHTGGDELAVRFKNPADAERVMADLQQQLEGMNVELDVADADGRVRSFTYEGIGISYGIGSNYEQADAGAGRNKIEREAAGVRQAKTDTRPSRRLREDTPRPGGRRAGDPAAEVAAQRSIPDGEPDAGAPVPAGVDPVAFFHLARMGAFHYADGARDMAEWTRRMQADLGPAAAQYRDALPAAFEASKAQASRPASGVETVAEALEAIGDRRRPRDVKRVVRAVVAEGMRGEAQVFEAAAQALDMETDDVRGLFAQPEPGPKTLSEAQAEINRLRKALRDAQRPDPETRYQNQRARDFQRRIAELEQRIAAGDFAKRERVERELTKENERLRYELEQAKTRFHQYAIAAEFAQRTPLGKLWGETVAGINFSRAIMTALDLSAVFRQGGFIVFGHPIRGAKAIPDMIRALLSDQADVEQRRNIQLRDNAPLYQRAGLQFTGIGGDALTRVEETFASRWIDKLASFEDIKIDWQSGKVFRAGAKAPFAILGGGVRGSGRAYTAFLNRLRADSFDAMLNALARDPQNPTTAEIKALANYINVATGRGDIAGYQPGEVLTATFFAPRLVASRFQLLAGQPLYGGSNRTRKLIAQEYARFLLGVSVAITLAAMMRDDEDETKLIELDPRSSDFGKVRFGNTYLDPLAGLAQVTVFLARVGTGETRRGADAATSEAMAESGIPMMDRDLGLRPLRDEYRLTDIAPGLGDGQPLGKVRYGGTDILRVGTNFIRSKLAPVPGWAINVTTGKDFKGDPISALEATGQLVVPMSAGNLVDVMEANGMMRGTAINLLGILGFSVQYRKPDAEELAEQQGGILGAVGVGTAEDLEE